MMSRLLVLATLLWAGALAQASDPCMETVRDLFERFDDPEGPRGWPIVSQALIPGSKCILGSDDSYTMRRHVDAMLAADATPEQKGNARGQLLVSLVEHFDSVVSEDCPGTASKCVAGRHEKQVRLLVERIRDGRFEADTAQRNEWAYQASGTVAVSYVDLKPMVDDACEQDFDQACLAAIDVAAKVVRSSRAVNEVLTSLYAPYIESSLQFMTLRDREWDAYLNGASVQFPWELAVNSYFYGRHESNQAGFPQPPSEHFVVLHPSVGVESIESADRGRQQAAAILVEVLGYQRWRWSDGEQRQRWGVSAIVSLADVDGLDAFGYGALIHTPFRNVAIGVVWRDGDNGGEVGITLNLDLAQLVQSHGSDAVKRFLGEASGVR